MTPLCRRSNPMFWPVLLLILTVCFGSQRAHAAAPASALVKNEQQAAKTMAQLARLQSQAQAGIDAADVLDDAIGASQRQLNAQSSSDQRLKDALRDVKDCPAKLESLLDTMGSAENTLHQAVSQSHAAVKAIAHGTDTVLAGVAEAADAIFVQRNAASAALLRVQEELQRSERRCTDLNNAAQWALRHSEMSASQLAKQSHRLIQLGKGLQSEWNATQAAFESAVQAGLLEAPEPAQVPPANQPPIDALAQVLSGSPRFATTTPTQLAPSITVSPDLQRLAPLWAQLERQQDAATYLDTQLNVNDCAPTACAAFTAERQGLVRRTADTKMSIAEAGQRWQQAPRTLARSLENTTDQQAALIADVEALRLALGPATTQLQDHAKAVHSAARPLLAAAQAAHASAEQTWRKAYRLAYGRAPDTDAGQEAGVESVMIESMPAQASAAMTLIRNHAFDRFSELDGEIKGFGAYTYVLVRSAIDMDSPPVRQRFVRLLATLQALPDATMVPKDLAETTNVFCVPVLPGSERSSRPENVPYASDLGQQLKMRAQNGLLTQASVRHRLSNSPGPFLITLPTRLSEGKSSTPVLIADLSTYPEAAIADLALHYMNGLVDDFPKQQALWKPPVLQRVALFMIHMAEGTGELITSAMPTAQASAPPR